MNSLYVSLLIDALILACTNQPLLIRNTHNFVLFSSNSGLFLWYCLDVFTNVPSSFPNTFMLYDLAGNVLSPLFHLSLLHLCWCSSSTLYKPACLFQLPNVSSTDLLWSEVSQSCPTLCDPMDCSLPGSSIHGLLQARVLEWVAISFSRGSSRPRDRTQVSCIPGLLGP